MLSKNIATFNQIYLTETCVRQVDCTGLSGLLGSLCSLVSPTCSTQSLTEQESENLPEFST